jgi:hypothetical protein
MTRIVCINAQHSRSSYDRLLCVEGSERKILKRSLGRGQYQVGRLPYALCSVTLTASNIGAQYFIPSASAGHNSIHGKDQIMYGYLAVGTDKPDGIGAPDAN